MNKFKNLILSIIHCVERSKYYRRKNVHNNFQLSVKLTTTTENNSLFFSSSEVDFERVIRSIDDEEWIEDVEDVEEVLEDKGDGMNWSNSRTLSSASRVSSLAMEYRSPNLRTRSAGLLSMPFDALYISTF